MSLWKLWDVRKKGAIHTFQNTYQVLAVTFSDTSDQILSGGIDNDIKVLGSNTNRKLIKLALRYKLIVRDESKMLNDNNSAVILQVYKK